MMSTEHQNALTGRLNENTLRRALIGHEFFQSVKSAPLTREQVAVFIGQWWHPLHYFPTFLARSVAVLPDIASKSAIARILNQETGEGRTHRAHEVVYVDSMERAGFTTAQASQAAPFAETAALLNGYERASEARYSALGFIFATEVADLAMVAGIGTAVERATGARDLAWVNIHVAQEPDHVEEADHAMLPSFSVSEEASIIERAEEMWALWIAFFDRLHRELFRAPHLVAERALEAQSA
jgi:pyrroloquinoline quinone (PQQ) biosynthesis protein C